VGGAVADKPARLVAAHEPILVAGPRPRFVGRGGEKLDAALEHFAVDVSGRRALDAGASTGGFTDCLLQRGAAEVVAVDVGHGQLHQSLRNHPRVVVLERTNVRHLTPTEIGGGATFEVVVADLSFISLRTVAAALTGSLAAPGADVVVLIKPQYEVGAAEASRGRGVVRDPERWAEALQAAGGALTDHGAAMMGVMVSPLTGADGNVEFLAHLRAHAPGPPGLPDFGPVLADALARHGGGRRPPRPAPRP
jgi:23S rRNA (cytidine1920-2'-O)/16S rRNA (cytidine1409-2'-O)-methyltransferase